MPYPPEHKQRTHQRIVATAARLFRQDGYRQTGVDRLMAAAGLTRGGFYAHFRDKATLLVEALELAFDESTENLFEGDFGELEGQEWILRAARRYLSTSHRGDAGQGCAVPALGAEVARSPRTVRRAFGQRLARLIDQISARVGEGPEARARAITLLSSWVGALLISRAVDGKLSDEVLSAVRERSPRF